MCVAGFGEDFCDFLPHSIESHSSVFHKEGAVSPPVRGAHFCRVKSIHGHSRALPPIMQLSHSAGSLLSQSCKVAGGGSKQKEVQSCLTLQTPRESDKQDIDLALQKNLRSDQLCYASPKPCFILPNLYHTAPPSQAQRLKRAGTELSPEDRHC